MMLRLLPKGCLFIHPRVRKRVARPSVRVTCLSPGYVNPLFGYKAGPAAFGPITFVTPRK